MTQLNAEITVRLPRALLVSLQDAAAAQDLTVGALVREALHKLLKVEEATVCFSNDQPDPHQELDKLSEAMRTAVRKASTWPVLQGALASKNLELWPKGGGLVLRTRDTKRELCKASETGFPYSKLIKRFRAGFPGHAHRWLADRVLLEERNTCM